jgi:hypothetical protein
MAEILSEVSFTVKSRASVQFSDGTYKTGRTYLGAVSVHIWASEDRIIWKDFGFENTYESEIRFEKLSDLGPFQFDIKNYRSKLAEAVTLLQP